MEEVQTRFKTEPKIGEMFAACFPNAITSTMEACPDGSTFVITGDIPAMWLRDSAAQVRPYLYFCDQNQRLSDLIAGVLKRQITYILHDPYANAFNKECNGNGHQDDLTQMTDLVWERKYEVDSLCYPIQLAYLLWKSSCSSDHFSADFLKAIHVIVDLWRTEQRHGEKSEYRFQRLNCPKSDTLPNDGVGAPVAYTGMTWSGFRPSDDACQYGYHLPSNMFATVALGYVMEIAEQIYQDQALQVKARQLRNEIQGGIEQFGKVEHPEFGTIYAYETDGLGNYNLMDDANVPSLLSLPYLGYCHSDDPVYLNTRNFILSDRNPYFFEGEFAKGVGSPHTPSGYVWHIALAIQGMTSTSTQEVADILAMFSKTDAGTFYTHESFDVNDPSQFTRAWFSWANGMFSELVLRYCGYELPGAPSF